MDIYKTQTSQHKLLREELDKLKRENETQISENEKLKEEVEKMKADAAVVAVTPHLKPELDVKRLLDEMDSLRDQLRVLDGNQVCSISFLTQ